MSERKGGVAVLFAARKRVSAGLYVGGRSFVYLALEESGGEVRVAASSSGTFQSQLGNGGSPFSASEAELSQAFGRVASSVKAARRHEVNFAVPMTESLLRVIPMQGLTRAEAKRAFRYEAERHFPFGSDDCVYDLDEIDYPLGGGSSERRFVVSAARRRTAEGVCRAARSCGISFGAMEPEQTAIERAASPARSTTPSRRATPPSASSGTTSLAPWPPSLPRRSTPSATREVGSRAVRRRSSR